MGLYVVESVKGANIFTKLAYIFLSLAFVEGWLAYCTANWGRTFVTEDDEIYTGYGVWRIGHNQEPNIAALGALHTDGWLLEWYGAFQAFSTLGFVSVNVGYFLIVLFVFVAPCKSNADLAFWNAINNIAGSLFWLVAVILFGAMFDEKYDETVPNTSGSGTIVMERELSYSFGFAIITFLCQLVAGIVLLLTNRGGGAVSSK